MSSVFAWKLFELSDIFAGVLRKFSQKTDVAIWGVSDLSKIGRKGGLNIISVKSEQIYP